jgi:hypothetical protein
MDPPDAEAERLQARARGREAGTSRSRRGADCPYRHDSMVLRLAWFDGFSEGRATLAVPALAGQGSGPGATGAVFPTGKAWHSS